MITVVEKSYGRFVELITYIPIGLAFNFLREKVNKNVIFLALSIVFSILFLLFSNIPVPPDFHFSGLKILSGSIGIFSLVIWLSNLKLSNKLSNIISFIGKYSFGVYLSHYLLLEVMLKFYPALKSFISAYQIVFLFLFIFSNYLLCFLFDLFTFKKFSYLVQ